MRNLKRRSEKADKAKAGAGTRLRGGRVRRSILVLRRRCATALAAALCAIVLSPGSALAASGDIETFAGGPGSGSALSVSQVPRAVAARDGVLYVSDSEWNVVRAIDLATGAETVLAGNGTAGSAGDGGGARAAQLSFPGGLAAGADGALYVADTQNHRVRRVAPDGIITTVAGNGLPGFTGEGAQATDARLNAPRDVAAAPDGTLFIADSSNNRVRRVGSDGVITTVAGNGAAGFSGDGGAATAAMLRDPRGAAVEDDGSLLIADSANNRVRRVTSDGVIVTLAGTGASGFSGDGGAATSAQLSFPVDVASDGAGGWLVADMLNHRARRVGSNGVIVTVAGTGAAGFSGDGGAAPGAALSSPQGVAAEGGVIYVADTGNRRARAIAADGEISTVAGTGLCCFGGDGGPATAAQLRAPQGLAADADGNVLVSDGADHRVRRVAPDGTISTLAGTGAAGGGGDGGPAAAAQLNAPWGLAAAGGSLYVADVNNNRIRRIDAGGAIHNFAGTGGLGFTGDGGPATAAQLRRPQGIAAGPSGEAYVADTGNNRVRRVDAGGGITTVAGSGVFGFSGDGGAATSAALRAPGAVAVAPDGGLYVADTGNHRVRRVAPDGTIDTVAGTGTAGYAGDGGPAAAARLWSPQSLALDAAGNLYVADTNNRRVRAVAPDGTITTVIGSGGCCFGGDGGPATDALLGTPAGVAVDGHGAIYVADAGSRRVRVVATDTTPPVTEIALSGTEGDGGWWRSAVGVTLTATDDSSGVARTEYRVDGGDWQEYSGPFTVQGDGEHLVGYRSIDEADNEEEARGREVRIDTTSPGIEIGTLESRVLLGEPVPIVWDASDETSGVASSAGTLNGEAVENGAEAVPSEPGTYTLVVTARDAAGNEATAEASFEVLVPAEVDFDPNVLATRARSSGGVVTMRVELPAGYDTAAIECPAWVHGPRGVAKSSCDGAPTTDRDGDGLPERAFRFSRDDLTAAAPVAPAEWSAETGGALPGGLEWIGWSAVQVR